MIGGVAVVLIGVIVLAVIFVVPRLTGGSGVALPGQPQADLSTPEKAAITFTDAVRTGNPDAVLPLTCIGNDGCIKQYGGPEATPDAIAKAKENLRTGVPAMAKQLADAQFRSSREGSAPGSVEVPYTTPSMEQGEHRFFSFYPHQGKWYYFGGGGGSSQGPPNQKHGRR